MLRNIMLRCPEDDEELLPIKDRIISFSEDETSMGYICPYCLERYISLRSIPKMEHVFAKGKKYINIWPEETTINSRHVSVSKKPSIRKNNNTKYSNSQFTNQRTITAHDFVVRRTIFKCMHDDHNVEDVRAVFTTISRMGTVNKITIPAGYCPTCKMYFIMESTYKRIKHSGIPICRTMDEKSYTKSADNYYNGLASESVLMQFGYNVSKTEDLPAGQRRRILAAIVDNDVLTKKEITSYLDFFISQRKTQKNRDGSLKFRDAIDKWRADRDWINAYELGSDKEVRIGRIIAGK